VHDICRHVFAAQGFPSCRNLHPFLAADAEAKTLLR
jgi:hypothetical protein